MDVSLDFRLGNQLISDTECRFLAIPASFAELSQYHGPFFFLDVLAPFPLRESIFVLLLAGILLAVVPSGQGCGSHVASSPCSFIISIRISVAVL